MRMFRAVTVGVGLLMAAGCGSDSPTTGASTTVPSTSPAAVAGAAGSIIPEAVCNNGGGVVFGYTNTGTAPVAIPLGPNNHLDGSDPTDEPLAPTVFAPGRVAQAFTSVDELGDHPNPSWSVTGPDGVGHTATADESMPFCVDVLPESNDTRRPVFDVSYKVVPASGSSAQQASIVVTLTGMSPSYCPAGLEPRSPIVILTLDDGAAVVGGPARATVPFGTQTDLTGKHSAVIASTHASAQVADVCAGAGAVTRSWPIFAPDLLDGQGVCLRDDAGAITMYQVGPFAPCLGEPLPLTDGAKKRSPLGV